MAWRESLYRLACRRIGIRFVLKDALLMRIWKAGCIGRRGTLIYSGRRECHCWTSSR